MSKKIFRLSFVTSMIVLAVSFLFVAGVLFDYFENSVFEELKSEADYISYGIKNDAGDFFETIDNDNKRVTVINPDGSVANDTSFNADGLENHKDREEVKEAMEKGYGKSTRYSDTLLQKTLYYAKKLDDGKILRVSTTQNSVFVIMLGFAQPIIIICVLVLIFSLLLSHRISKSIIKPILEIDLENPAENSTYEELTPILKKLSTQKKTIDRQIKEAAYKQKEFELITENMSEGLLVIDKDKNVLSYNSASLKLLNVTEPNRDNVLCFNRTKEFRETVKKALLGERAESNIICGDSTYDLIASPVYGKEKVIGGVILIIDVTEKSKREQLRREFTSNVSHELKTPLTSISGFAEMLRQGDAAKDTVVDFSSSIYDEAQRLITLVEDIIKISELDEGTDVYQKEQVDLFSISKEVADRLKTVAKKNNISLDVVGDTAYVCGAKKILDEMIYNLCDNAVKYNKQNGSVVITVNQEDNKTTLAVKDTGIGIPSGEQARVFERFYRVDKSHSKLIGGTGLGLAIVKHGAVYHNAEVVLNSAENIGTTITLVFERQ